MKRLFQPTKSDDPLDELERLRGEVRRARSERSATNDLLERLSDREAELAEGDVAAYLGDCDPIEHDRQRQRLEVEKVAATTDRDRLARVVDGLEDRCSDLINEIAKQRREDEFARRRAIEDEVAELHARLAVLDAAYANTDARLAEVDGWREREQRDGGLGRADDPPVTLMPEEQTYVATLPDFADLVRLPNGQPAYARLVETGGGAVAYFGRTPLSAIRAQQVKAYAADLTKQGKARNTIRLRTGLWLMT